MPRGGHFAAMARSACENVHYLRCVLGSPNARRDVCATQVWQPPANIGFPKDSPKPNREGNHTRGNATAGAQRIELSKKWGVLCSKAALWFRCFPDRQQRGLRLGGSSRSPHLPQSAMNASKCRGTPWAWSMRMRNWRRRPWSLVGRVVPRK